MDAFGVEAHDDAFFFEERFSMEAESVFVFADKIRRGDLSIIVTWLPKRRKHLCEFEADVASAHDDEMTREGFLDRESPTLVIHGVSATPGKVRCDGAATDVDEDLIGGKEIVTDANLLWRFEGCVASEDSTVLHAAKPGFQNRFEISGRSGLCGQLVAAFMSTETAPGTVTP